MANATELLAGSAPLTRFTVPYLPSRVMDRRVAEGRGVQLVLDPDDQRVAQLLKGEELRVYAAANDEEEARFVVDEVKQLHREGMNLSDMALLYRSNAQSRVLEHSLFRAGIAYKVYGGLRFFERQEVKHALAYLRLTASGNDDGALTRIINFPARGI